MKTRENAKKAARQTLDGKGLPLLHWKKVNDHVGRMNQRNATLLWLNPILWYKSIGEE